MTKQTFVDVFNKEYNKERCNEIVDALHIATGRVAYRPNIQDALKYLKYISQKSSLNKQLIRY